MKTSWWVPIIVQGRELDSVSVDAPTPTKAKRLARAIYEEQGYFDPRYMGPNRYVRVGEPIPFSSPQSSEVASG